VFQRLECPVQPQHPPLAAPVADLETPLPFLEARGEQLGLRHLVKGAVGEVVAEGGVDVDGDRVGRKDGNGGIRRRDFARRDLAEELRPRRRFRCGADGGGSDVERRGEQLEGRDGLVAFREHLPRDVRPADLLGIRRRAGVDDRVPEQREVGVEPRHRRAMKGLACDDRRDLVDGDVAADRGRPMGAGDHEREQGEVPDHGYGGAGLKMIDVSGPGILTIFTFVVFHAGTSPQYPDRAFVSKSA
jgi:hypothetical protein